MFLRPKLVMLETSLNKNLHIFALAHSSLGFSSFNWNSIKLFLQYCQELSRKLKMAGYTKKTCPELNLSLVCGYL